MRYFPIAGLALALHSPSLAQSGDGAQPADEARPAAAERSERQVQVRENNQSVDNDVRTGFLGSGVLVSAGSDATNVSLSLARSWDGGDANNLSFNTGSLVLSAPITDKDRKEGAFVTEGGLPNSYSLQAAFTRAWIPNRPLPGNIGLRRELLTRARDRCAIAAPTTVSRTACATATMRDVENHLSRDEQRAISDRFPLWLAGVSGSIGRREFEFRRPTDFMKDSVDRTEFAASAYLGMTPGSPATYFGIGYEYRRQYKNIAARTLCPPVAPGAVQECFTASFGEPVRNIDSNIMGVARWQGNLSVLGGSLPMGIELRATYDLRDRVFGLALPIYLLSGSDGLRGGVRFNWQDVDDRDERFGFRVFIGTPFRLLGS